MFFFLENTDSEFKRCFSCLQLNLEFLISLPVSNPLSFYQYKCEKSLNTVSWKYICLDCQKSYGIDYLSQQEYFIYCQYDLQKTNTSISDISERFNLSEREINTILIHAERVGFPIKRGNKQKTNLSNKESLALELSQKFSLSHNYQHQIITTGAFKQTLLKYYLKNLKSKGYKIPNAKTRLILSKVSLLKYLNFPLLHLELKEAITKFSNANSGFYEHQLGFLEKEIYREFPVYKIRGQLSQEIFFFLRANKEDWGRKEIIINRDYPMGKLQRSLDFLLSLGVVTCKNPEAKLKQRQYAIASIFNLELRDIYH